MTLERITSEIRKRWEEIAAELVRRKRLDPNIYEEVVSTLARNQCADSEHDDLRSG